MPAGQVRSRSHTSSALQNQSLCHLQWSWIDSCPLMCAPAVIEPGNVLSTAQGQASAQSIWLTSWLQCDAGGTAEALASSADQPTPRRGPHQNSTASPRRVARLFQELPASDEEQPSDARQQPAAGLLPPAADVPEQLALTAVAAAEPAASEQGTAAVAHTGAAGPGTMAVAAADEGVPLANQQRAEQQQAKAPLQAADDASRLAATVAATRDPDPVPADSDASMQPLPEAVAATLLDKGPSPSSAPEDAEAISAPAAGPVSADIGSLGQQAKATWQAERPAVDKAASQPPRDAAPGQATSQSPEAGNIGATAALLRPRDQPANAARPASVDAAALSHGADYLSALSPEEAPQRRRKAATKRKRRPLVTGSDEEGAAGPPAAKRAATDARAPTPAKAPAPAPTSPAAARPTATVAPQPPPAPPAIPPTHATTVAAAAAGQQLRWGAIPALPRVVPEQPISAVARQRAVRHAGAAAQPLAGSVVGGPANIGHLPLAAGLAVQQQPIARSTVAAEPVTTGGTARRPVLSRR